MGLIGGSQAYRFLRWYAAGKEAASEVATAYSGKSKLRILLGDALLSEVRDRDVIDFGCGEGNEAIEIALAGARSVVGIDILTDRFPEAIRRSQAAGVGEKVRFLTLPELPVDLIVSLDSFEHFDDPGEILRVMSTFLRPGGRVVASFGPTWYHPLGGHLFSVFPWAHLIFTEKVLIRWRSDFKSDGARHFREVAGGLNQMTVARFKRIVNDSPFRIVYF